MPLISIIVPVYNAEAFLETCLNSLLTQTLTGLEIIAVDDGSIDRSPEILDCYAGKYRQLKVFHTKNSGVSAARNIGLAAADGDFIGFVDADDFIESDMFKKMTDSAAQNQADIVFCRYFSEFRDGFKEKHFDLEAGLYAGSRKNNLVRRMIGPLAAEKPDPVKLDFLSSVWNMIYRRELIRKCQAHFTDLNEIGSCEDLLFNVQVCSSAERMFYLDLPMYHYNRTNSGSITSGYRPWLFTRWKRLFTMIRDQIDLFDIGDPGREALSNRICLCVINLAFNISESGYSSIRQAKELKAILEDPLIQNSLLTFPISRLTRRWRLYYFLAKHRYAFPLLIVSNMMNALRKSKLLFPRTKGIAV